MVESKSEILEYLTKTNFEEEQNSGITSFYNKLGTGERQGVVVGFVKDYDNSKDAATAEVLLDFYIAGLSKGTKDFPSNDALIRAFRRSRSPSPTIYSRRVQNKVMFAIQTYLPPEEKGFKAAEGTVEIVQNIFDNSRIANDSDLLETLRDEMERGIKSRISRHRYRANSFFFQQYFPEFTPFGDDEELDLVMNADYEQLHQVFDQHISSSAPVIIYSGQDQSLKNPFENITKMGGNKKLSDLRRASTFELNGLSDRIHIDGPSSQMQFMRVYPLNSIPETREEKEGLRMFNTLLGGSWTAPLMQIIREKHNLVYGFYSNYSKQTNSFFLPTDHDPKSFDKIEKLTYEIVKDLVQGNSFKDETFEMARDTKLEEMICNSGRTIVTANQASFRISKEVSKSVFKGVDFTPVERFHTIESFDAEFIRELARKFIDPESSQLFTYGGNVK